jgi:hypothetical protein
VDGPRLARRKKMPKGKGYPKKSTKKPKKKKKKRKK